MEGKEEEEKEKEKGSGTILKCLSIFMPCSQQCHKVDCYCSRFTGTEIEAQRD